MNISSFFKRSKPKEQTIPSINEEHWEILAQAREDESYDRCVKREAHFLYREWLMAPTFFIGDKEHKPFIPIVRGLKTFYYIHHEATARHRESSYHKLVIAEYLRLRKSTPQSPESLL